jgi:NAD(P)-dependent dehydrogenase (short-subunit alcohol dehydrogenase family)
VNPARRLEGKSVLLTGAAGGVGAAAMRIFAHAGARILATDLAESGDELLTTSRVEHLEAEYVSADLSTSSGRAKVLDAGKRWAPIDVLYSNHGIIRGRKIEDTTEEDWAQIQSVNVESVFFLIKGALPLLRDGASIVIITSAAGLAAQPNMAAYSASKGALVMLTRALALDLSGRRIRVNAIAPGLIDTPMPRSFVNSFDSPDAVWDNLIHSNMLGRAGLPEEVAHLALHLASDESGFTTGAVIPMDGGRTAM